MATSDDAQKELQPQVQEIKKCRWQHYLLLPAAVLALILSGYSSYQTWQLKSQAGRIQTGLQEDLAAFRMSQQDANNQWQTASQDRQQKLQIRVEELNKTLKTALQQRFYQKQDWLLLKARYLLELAQINAHWSKDQQTTVVLLQEADKVLQDTAEQSIYPVRQAIADEIAQIQANPAVDIVGILSKLDAAQNTVTQLPVRRQTTPVTSGAEKTTQSAWRERLSENISLLEKLVVIRHHNKDIKQMLSPVYQSLLIETIRMDLQEAQWAVLQGNSTIYQQALAQALREIKRVFEQNAQGTQALISQLEALQQNKLDIARPQLEQSLSLLNQFIEQKTQVPMPATEGNPQ
ncbi:uroporphyrinogen-III C-methyltransferase [Legionella dresdenensis]|uniref:Uroporphyrinogen-III C-methyltransferase n=1 Tax=Legionella dresdenensis TaxID=450200 RepID=A0ABV8CCR9_9GAMM